MANFSLLPKWVFESDTVYIVLGRFSSNKIINIQIRPCIKIYKIGGCVSSRAVYSTVSYKLGRDMYALRHGTRGVVTLRSTCTVGWAVASSAVLGQPPECIREWTPSPPTVLSAFPQFCQPSRASLPSRHHLELFNFPSASRHDTTFELPSRHKISIVLYSRAPNKF